MRLLKGFTAAAVLVTALTASVASAETVTFSTTGAFASGTTVGSVSSVTVNGYTLVFTGVTAQTVFPEPGLDAATDFGTFTVTTAGTATSSFSEAFTLNVEQASPTSGSGTMAGLVTGTIKLNAGKLTLDLNPNTLVFGNVTYSLDNDPMVISTTVGSESDIRVTASVVPVPAAVWGGVSLLGLLGGGRLWKRRRDLA